MYLQHFLMPANISKKIVVFFVLLLTLICFTHKAQAQQHFIGLSTGQVHDLEIKETGDKAYQVITTGNDPYIFSLPLDSALAQGYTTLTFEYFSAGYLDQFQVFFGPPIDENKSISVELGIREGWTTQSIDVSEVIKNWGNKNDFLRFDFGASPKYQIQLKNIHFRKPTAEELAKAANRNAKKQAENMVKQKLSDYLDAGYSCTINDVSVLKNTIIIKGNNTVGKNLFIAEVPLYKNVMLDSSFENIFPVPSSKQEFVITVPRYTNLANRKADRLLSKWVLISKNKNYYTLQSHARYADHIQSLYNYPQDKLRGKKGLGGFSSNAFVSDLDSLNITSVTVNMWITQMMRSKPSEKNIAFNYNGKTYYADKKWVAKADSTLLQTAKRNIIVSSIILIDKAVNCPDKEIGRIFQHPDCDPSGIYSMANVTSAEGVEYYAAAIDFLAARYSRPDKKYGRIHHWIMHNEVDAGWVWTNMGEKDSLLFMDTYHKSMRLVYNIARSYNPNAKTFISLTHYWNWTVDKHFYHSKDLLELLLKYSAKEGDFEWAIAHHPYPESLFEPKSWEDAKATFSFETPLITFKNIEVLNAWVKQPSTMYKGKYRREVFLSEQGPNSKDYTSQALNEQAASIAYLWKKLEVLDGIDAFQFHNWIDNRREGGLRIGLRRFRDDETDPGGKKPVWYVYRDLETSRENDAIEFAKKIIGISNWSEVQYHENIK